MEDYPFFEQYIKDLNGLFYAAEQLKRKDASLSNLAGLSVRDQDFWKDQGEKILRYFTQFPRKKEGEEARAIMNFVKWAGCGGEVGVAQAQDSKLGRLYCVRIARPEFNEPDVTVTRRLKKSLFGPEEVVKKVNKNVPRHRFIEGHKAQQLIHWNFESTRFPFGKIQKVYHINETAPVYAVLSWAPGENFQSWCFKNRGEENMKIRAFVFWCILKSVERIHDKKIVHRDLTPRNIIITPRRIPYISDFGMVRNPDKNRNLTVPGTSLGNALYSAPEQILKESAHLATYRSDVYSLGWIMRWMFKLLHPPDHIHDRQLRLSEQHQVPPPFRDLFWTATRDRIDDRLDISDFIGEYENIFRKIDGFAFDPNTMFLDDIEEDRTIIEPAGQVSPEIWAEIREENKLIIQQLEKHNNLLTLVMEGLEDHKRKFEEMHKILQDR